MPAIRPLALTPDHVAFIRREVAEEAPLPGFRPFSGEEYAAMAASTLAADPAPEGPLRLFVYGSLIWKPEVGHEAEEQAILRGWHRSFCLSMSRHRGTPDFPGLMMALDRGGSCRGLILTLEAGDKAAQVEKLLRREMPQSPPGNLATWVAPRTAKGAVPALAFVVNRASSRYRRRLPEDEVADILARACGHGGSGAEYLLNTVSGLESRGIRDSLLYRLQAMVADRIEAMITP